jgi:ATP-dependent exoDNAse (exonuclease V) beta subunit
MNNETLQKGYTNKDLYDLYNNENNNKDIEVSDWIYEIEWNHFINFLNAFPELKPYRTEWKIYHEDLKISGCIDMVYENTDGTISIFDWKRSKEINTTNSWNKFALTECISHLPDTNFWHYSLQLNIYKTILEEKYDKIVKDLFLVRFHASNPSNTFDLLPVPFLKKEIEDLFLLRKQKLLKIT